MKPVCSVCEIHAESTFKVEGMDCREEVVLIERRFKGLPGLERFAGVATVFIGIRRRGVEMVKTVVNGVFDDFQRLVFIPDRKPATASANDNAWNANTGQSQLCCGHAMSVKGCRLSRERK